MKRFLLIPILLLAALSAFAQTPKPVKSVLLQKADGKQLSRCDYSYNADGTIASVSYNNYEWNESYTINYRYDENTRTCRITDPDDPDFCQQMLFLPSYSVYGTHEPWTAVIAQDEAERADGSSLGWFRQLFYDEGRVYYCCEEQFTSNEGSSLRFNWTDEGNLSAIYISDSWMDEVIDHFVYADEPDPFPVLGVNPVCFVLQPEFPTWEMGMAGYRWKKQLNGFTTKIAYEGDEVAETQVYTLSYMKDFTGLVRRIRIEVDGKLTYEIMLSY